MAINKRTPLLAKPRMSTVQPIGAPLPCHPTPVRLGLPMGTEPRNVVTGNDLDRLMDVQGSDEVPRDQLYEVSGRLPVTKFDQTEQPSAQHSQDGGTLAPSSGQSMAPRTIVNLSDYLPSDPFHTMYSFSQ